MCCFPALNRVIMSLVKTHRQGFPAVREHLIKNKSPQVQRGVIFQHFELNDRSSTQRVIYRWRQQLGHSISTPREKKKSSKFARNYPLGSDDPLHHKYRKFIYKKQKFKETKKKGKSKTKLRPYLKLHYEAKPRGNKILRKVNESYKGCTGLVMSARTDA